MNRGAGRERASSPDISRPESIAPLGESLHTRRVGDGICSIDVTSQKRNQKRHVAPDKEVGWDGKTNKNSGDVIITLSVVRRASVFAPWSVRQRENLSKRFALNSSSPCALLPLSKCGGWQAREIVAARNENFLEMTNPKRARLQTTEAARRFSFRRRTGIESMDTFHTHFGILLSYQNIFSSSTLSLKPPCPCLHRDSSRCRRHPYHPLQRPTSPPPRR